MKRHGKYRQREEDRRRLNRESLDWWPKWANARTGNQPQIGRSGYVRKLEADPAAEAKAQALRERRNAKRLSDALSWRWPALVADHRARQARQAENARLDAIVVR